MKTMFVRLYLQMFLGGIMSLLCSLHILVSNTYWMYTRVTWRVSYKRQELLPLREHLSSPQFCSGVRVALRLSFFQIVLSCVFTFGVPYCDVPYDFHIKPMFGSSLPPVVYRRVHVLFRLFVLACAQWCPSHIVFLFCFSSSSVHYVVSFSGLSLLVAPSVSSNVYLLDRIRPPNP